MEQDRTITRGRIASDAADGLLGDMRRLYSGQGDRRDFRVVERESLPMMASAMVYFAVNPGDQPLAPNARNYAGLGVGELLYHVDRMVRVWDIVIDPYGRGRVEDHKRLVPLERVIGVFWHDCATVGGDAGDRAGSPGDAMHD